MAADVEDELAVERAVTAEGGERADAAHLQAEADGPEAEDADGVDEEVHAHRVADVLGAHEAGLDQSEAGLHEHHQEAGDERPDDIETCLRIGDRFCDVRE